MEAYQYDIKTRRVTKIIRYDKPSLLEKYALAEIPLNSDKDRITHSPNFGTEAGLHLGPEAQIIVLEELYESEIKEEES